LRCSPVVFRHHREENRYKNPKENGYRHGVVSYNQFTPIRRSRRKAPVGAGGLCPWHEWTHVVDEKSGLHAHRPKPATLSRFIRSCASSSPKSVSISGLSRCLPQHLKCACYDCPPMWKECEDRCCSMEYLSSGQSMWNCHQDREGKAKRSPGEFMIAWNANLCVICGHPLIKQSHSQPIPVR